MSESTFTVTAVNERGGNIIVNSQGVFLPPNASFDDIFDASSQERPRFDGLVEINTPDVDLSRTAAEPTATPESPKVTSTCQGSLDASESALVNTGTGGTPSSFINSLSQSAGWQEPSPSPQNPQATVNNTQSEQHSSTEQPEQFVQANGWIRNSDGTVDFIADASNAAPYSWQATPACSQANTLEEAQ